MTAKYTPRKKRRKADPRPAKPYPDFPLYAHSLGYWSKKINKKIIHFGRWGRVVKGELQLLPFEENWRAALSAYEVRKADAYAGRIREFVLRSDQSSASDGKRVLGELCDKFLNAKRLQLKSGEIGQRMYDEYKSITDVIVEKFGNQRAIDDLIATDFESLRDAMSNRWGPVRLSNAITRVKSVFKYAYEVGLLDRPIPCLQPNSSIFKKPSADVLRKHRAKNGKRMLEATDCRKLLDALDGQEVIARVDAMTGEPVKVTLDRDPQLRAMVLLGLNCGFGNHDCAMLPMSALNLDSGWIIFPRPKTGVERRCPLWLETVSALKASIAERPTAKEVDAEPLVFVTSRGRAWLSNGIANPVSVATRAAMKAIGIHRAGRRRGPGTTPAQPVVSAANSTPPFSLPPFLIGWVFTH